MKSCPRKDRIFTVIGCIFILFAWAGSAFAGTITLNFELQGNTCVVANRGDSSAYYPVIFQLGSNGQWIPLQSNLSSPELLPGQTVAAELLASRALPDKADIADLQVVLARFFDFSGVTYGQVAVLRSPPAGSHQVTAVYGKNKLLLDAPADSGKILATWILTPWDGGIAPTLKPQSFTFHQPPATRIDWKKTSHAEIATGVVLPSVMLVHETPAGFILQKVEKGNAKKREQRTAWLDLKKPFYVISMLCGIVGLLLLLYNPTDRNRIEP